MYLINIIIVIIITLPDRPQKPIEVATVKQ